MKLSTMLAAGAGAGAIALGLTAAPAAQAQSAKWVAPYCQALQSNDGKSLYPAICGTSAPGTYWKMVITVCGPGRCTTTTTPTYRQGQIASFRTGGYISGVRFVKF